MLQPPRLIKWIVSVVLLFLGLLTAFRFIFYWQYAPTTGSFPLDAFVMGLRLDLRVVAALGLLMLILCAVPFINPFKNRKAKTFWNLFLPFVFLILLFLYVIDFFHYDYLHQRLNASVLNYLHDAGISMSMVWQTYPVLRSLLLIILLVIATAYLFSKLLSHFLAGERAPKKAKFWIIPLVLLLLLGCWGSLGQFALRWSDVFTLTNAFKAQLALNPVQSFFSTLSFRTTTYDLEKAKKSYPLMAEFLGIPSTDTSLLNYDRYIVPNGPIDSSQQPNVVLVICESFSAYKSSMWGNPLNTTPFFDSLSRRGIFFDHCFTPSYGTARGIWATITGLPDVNTPKTASRNPAVIDQQTIINDFKGYEKFYFIGGSASWANIRGLLQFNIRGLKLYEQEDFDAAQVDVWGVSDKNLFLNANEVLAKQQKPFFAIIQTADNHRPFTIPAEDEDEFDRKLLPEDSLLQHGFTSNEEYNAFRYTDFCIRKFIKAAKHQPYFQNTVFVFVGDHGVRGNTGPDFPKSWTEQGLTVSHVPLLFYSQLVQPERRSNVCSQLDVLPSIAGLLSVPFHNTTLGKNLFDPELNKQPLRASSAFFFNPDDQEIAMITDQYYFWKSIGKENFKMVSVQNNEPIPKNHLFDSVTSKLNTYTEAFYQTSRYLLYHNEKDK
jgi:phosphoglycerol transferase MdoB-like AlkP superfamily enzyme